MADQEFPLQYQALEARCAPLTLLGDLDIAQAIDSNGPTSPHLRNLDMLRPHAIDMVPIAGKNKTLR